jgi:hypothetical protein
MICHLTGGQKRAQKGKDQQCMLTDAGGDFRKVGKHGKVVELCSCMESVHGGEVLHCL